MMRRGDRGEAKTSLAVRLSVFALGVVCLLAMLLTHSHQLLFGPREHLPFSTGLEQRMAEAAASRLSERVRQAAAAGAGVNHSAACEPGVDGLVGVPHTERWGDVVVSASGGEGHSAASAAACCQACAAHRDCNIYVWCAVPESCQQQCWLKRSGKAAELDSPAHGAGEGVPWQSGVLPGKSLDVATPVLPGASPLPLPERSVELYPF